MGREVRRVPKDWEHPHRTDGRDDYQPMYDESFAEAAREWKIQFAEWEDGKRPYYCTDSQTDEFWEYEGDPPDRKFYRPEWTDAERTHWQMYETTSEGTPISPVMETPELLARWLADNKASAFASDTATYDQWLNMIRVGYACSAEFSRETGMISGVVAISLRK